MRPPRIVYSLVIRNRSRRGVTVSVTYTDIGNNTHRERVVVPANGVATVGEKTTKSGMAYFGMEITKVEIDGASVRGSASSLSAPFPAVHSPMKDYPIEIVTKNGALTLVATNRE